MSGNKWSRDVYVKAWDFATIAHEGQTYGGPIEGQRVDYINHIGSVAMELLWALNDSDNINCDLSIQCALLHDTIEDTKFTYEDILSEFGKEVADGVMALTKNESLSTKRDQMLDSLARIKCQPKEVWMVKLADRITNLSQPPAYWNKDKRSNYRDEAILILEELGTSNKLLSSRMSQRINDYAQFVEMV